MAYDYYFNSEKIKDGQVISDIQVTKAWLEGQDGVTLAHMNVTKQAVIVRQAKPAHDGFFQIAAPLDDGSRQIIDKTMDDGMKTAAIEILKTWREAAIQADFDFNGNTFQGDNEISAPNMKEAALMAMFSISVNQPFEIHWTTADDQSVTFDAMGSIGLASAWGVRKNATWEQYKAHKASIVAATDAAGIKAVLDQVA